MTAVSKNDLTLAQKIDRYAKAVLSAISTITIAAASFSTVAALPAIVVTAASALGTVAVLIKGNLLTVEDIANKVDGNPAT